MKVFIGADHRGFKLKEKLVKKFAKYEFQDEGAYKLDPGDDYPLYAEKVAVLVADNEGSKGILLCGSGVGVDIVANKIDGARASIGKSADQVKKGREDDDMNILVIAADFTTEKEAEKMVEVFLKTKFSGKERHKRRIAEVKKIEANN